MMMTMMMIVVVIIIIIIIMPTSVTMISRCIASISRIFKRCFPALFSLPPSFGESSSFLPVDNDKVPEQLQVAAASIMRVTSMANVHVTAISIIHATAIVGTHLTSIANTLVHRPSQPPPLPSSVLA